MNWWRFWHQYVQQKGITSFIKWNCCSARFFSFSVAWHTHVAFLWNIAFFWSSYLTDYVTDNINVDDPGHRLGAGKWWVWHFLRDLAQVCILSLNRQAKDPAELSSCKKLTAWFRGSAAQKHMLQELHCPLDFCSVVTSIYRGSVLFARCVNH